MSNSIHVAIAALASVLFTLVSPFALAQGSAYPNRAVRLIVPFPPGGATDIMARNVAQRLGEAWKQPIVVENRPGGNGMIGADAVVKAAADGYTLLAATIAHAANASPFPNAPYHFERDLQAVAVMGLIPLVPVVRADSPIRSMPDLVAAAKARNLNAGSSGNGTASHLGLESFKVVTGAKLQHVPYKGGAPAMTDLLGGQIDVIFALLPECLPHVRSGKLRPLAVTTDKRYPLLPDVPTAAEAGTSGIEITSWNGLMVRSGTPADVVSKVHAEVSRIMSAPDMRARVIEQGFQPVAMSAAETEAFIKADTMRLAKVIREAGVKAD